MPEGSIECIISFQKKDGTVWGEGRNAGDLDLK